MSNLGFQSVYSRLNARDDVTCQRVFLSLEKNSEGKNTAVVSFEEGLALRTFDVIAFSVSFELDYIGVLRVIRASGVPLLGEDREGYPLVLMGGICAFTNPEPLALFVDGIFLGDAETTLNPVLDTLVRLKEENASREKALLELSKCNAFYVPSLFEHTPLKKLNISHATSISKEPVYSKLLTPNTEFGDKCLIEVTRGCPYKCSFCVVGNNCGSFRMQSLKNIYKITEDYIAAQGGSAKHGEKTKIGFVGASVSDHTDFKQMLRFALEKNCSLAIASLRADRLDDELAEILSKSGYKTVSLAPEVGSENLINLLKKGIRKEHIQRAIGFLVDHDVLNFRLYFIIGLPGECDEDILEFVEYVKDVYASYLSKCRKKGRIGCLTLSINPFVPKPFTPFQWFPMRSKSYLKARIKFLRKEFAKVPNLRVQFSSVQQSIQQALLSLGGREISGILISQLEGEENRGELKSCLDRVVFREKAEDEELPWDFIQQSELKKHLRKKYNLVRSKIA